MQVQLELRAESRTTAMTCVGIMYGIRDNRIDVFRAENNVQNQAARILVLRIMYGIRVNIAEKTHLLQFSKPPEVSAGCRQNQGHFYRIKYNTDSQISYNTLFFSGSQDRFNGFIYI